MKKWEQNLESFGMMIAGIQECLDAKTQEELLQLRKDCDQPNRTNCWCYAYQAAQYLKPILDGMIRPETIEADRKPE